MKTYLALAFALLVPSALHAQVFSSGSDGSDGALSIATDTTMAIDQPVYNYTTISVEAGATLTLTADPLFNYPAVWKASGDVTISGDIVLDGGIGHGPNASFVQSVPGPGGWAGGIGARSNTDPSLAAQPGQGPGGALGPAVGLGAGGYGAGYAALGGLAGVSTEPSLRGQIYGNEFLIPLEGGSGGSGSRQGGNESGGGGAGGGAISIASSGTMAIAGSISANGGAGGGNTQSPIVNAGGGGGSGGGILLNSNAIAVTGTLSAIGGSPGSQGNSTLSGGTGSAGRIRVNAYSVEIGNAIITPLATTGLPLLNDLADIAPRIAIVSIDGQTVTNPRGVPASPDLTVTTNAPVTIAISATNIPLDAVVTILVLPTSAPGARATAAPLTGTVASSTTTADVAFGPGANQLIATASFTSTKSSEAELIVSSVPVAWE